MIDADGVQHDFEEKIPIVTEEDLWDDTLFPRQGSIACEVISTWIANDGRALSKIDTSKPWGIESKTGATEFVVLSDSLQPIAQNNNANKTLHPTAGNVLLSLNTRSGTVSKVEV